MAPPKDPGSGKKGGHKVYRSAVTGKYITESEAKKAPRTTVSETVKPSKKKGK